MEAHTMKIVLVQPKVPWNSSWECISLGYCKAYAEQFNETWDFDFFSGFFDSDKEIIEACSNADIVGFTCTTPQMAHAKKIIEGISFSDGTPKIVIGGVHASAQPNHTLEISDYAVQGEGEMAFVKILRGKAPLGIVRMPYMQNLDYLPPPDRHFIKQYRNIEVAFKDNKERIGSIFSSRGCPYGCLRAGTEVTMFNGAKKLIEDVQVGDLVYTYDKHDMKKSVSTVVEIADYSPTPILKFICGYPGSTRPVRLWLTPNHEIFTDHGWDRAENVFPGDKIMVIWKAPINVPTQETIRKARERMTIANPMFDLKTRRKMATTQKIRFQTPEGKVRIAMTVSEGHRTRMEKQGGLSKGEIRLLDIVSTLYHGEIRTNYPVLTYLIDVAIPEFKLGLEYDGHSRHWTNPEHDIKRDKELAGVGWKIIRFANKEIWDRASATAKISKALGSTVENTHRWMEVQQIVHEKNPTHRLYDLQVEPANTFVANGVLVSNCVFCSSREVWSRRVRFHSAERVVAEMKHLVNDWAIDFIKFSDDTFTVSEKRVSEICDLIKQEKLTVPWGCNIRANTSDALLKKMKDSNCREVWVGAESGDDNILRDMKKGITTEMIRHVFQETKKLGLYRRVYFMIGMPNDSWETIERTRQLAEDIDADQYGFSIYDALPNNSLWKDEYLQTRNLEQMDEYNNPWTTTKTLTNEDLQVAQRMLCKEFKGRMCWRQKGEV